MPFDRYSGALASLQTAFRWQAERTPDKPFCVLEGTQHTYGAVEAAANQVAHALERRFGVTKGDVVAVYSPNRLEFFHAMFGIQRLGAVYSPCSTYYSPDELEYQLTHSGVTVVFVDESLQDNLEQVRAACPTLRGVVVFGDGPASTTPGTVSFAELVEGQPGEPPAAAAGVTADDLAMVMYTSGTTDRPKGVMFTHGNLVSTGFANVIALGWTESDRYLHYFPMFHFNGGMGSVAPTALVGATIVMIPHFSASRFGQQLVDHGITVAPVNSTNVKMILNNPVSEHDRAHACRRMRLGLSLTVEEIERFQDRFDTTLLGCYGMTETLGACVSDIASTPRRTGSAGRVLPGYTLEILDEEGRELPAGEPGEVVVSATDHHDLSAGYYRDPERTAEVFRGGRISSGDVGYVDDDGYFWFVERKKDMIKRSGFNVAAAEVERSILGVEGVVDVAVVGTPDLVREEAIVAFVVRSGEAVVDEARIVEVCAKELAEYKVPQVVEFLDELPRNFVGKLDRKALRVEALRFRVDSAEKRPLGRHEG